MRNRLYRITAHCGSKAHTYYVVATGTTAAEEGVSQMHRDNKWSDVDHFDSETVAEEYTYGKPVPLILANAASEAP